MAGPFAALRGLFSNGSWSLALGGGVDLRSSRPAARHPWEAATGTEGC